MVLSSVTSNRGLKRHNFDLAFDGALNTPPPSVLSGARYLFCVAAVDVVLESK